MVGISAEITGGQNKNLKELIRLHEKLEDVIGEMSNLYERIYDCDMELDIRVLSSIPDIEIFSDSLDYILEGQATYMEELRLAYKRYVEEQNEFYKEHVAEINDNGSPIKVNDETLTAKEHELLKELCTVNAILAQEGLEDKFVATFEYMGHTIYNPLMDETGRFRVDPIEHYGADELKRMLQQYKGYKLAKGLRAFQGIGMYPY